MIGNEKENKNSIDIGQEDVSKEDMSKEVDVVVSEEKKELQAAKKKKRSDSIKKSFANQQFKSGAYSTFVTILVIALVVIVNLVFNKLDLSTDLSSGSLFTLSKDTKKMVKDIEEDITIYYMVQKGMEEDYVQRVVEQYKKISSHVKVEAKNPVVYPAFSKQFVDDEIANNDVIVVNESTKAAKYISVDDMLYQDSYSSYGDGQTYLDVEGRVTSAIQYVLARDVKKVYMVSGHGEQQLTDDLQVTLEKMNMAVEDLALLTEGKVPSDCNVLLLYGPTKDLEDGEKKAILDYLKAGGDALIFPMYTTEKMPNLEEILEYYGVGIQKGIIYEGAGRYMDSPNYIVPEVNTDSEIMSKLGSDEYIVMAYAQSLTMADSASLRSSVTITDLLSTSKQSLLKVNPASGETKKEKGDKEGPFYTGLYVEETLNGEEKTKLAVYSTSAVLDNVLENSISTLIGTTEENSSVVSIDAKNLSYSTVTMNVGSQIFWSAVLIIFLPVGLLIAGFGIWFVRRRK